MITHRNSLDICPGGVPLFIRLSQYDSSFTLIFDLFSHKGTFTVENGTTARFRELKPDGNALSLDATISGTVVTLAPTQANAQQMTAIAGNCKCELSLFKNDKELNTANFTLIIEKAVIDKDTPYSDSVIRELIDVTDRADEIMNAAELVDEAIADLPNLIDPTLSLQGHAADAKATGDKIADLETILDDGNIAISKVADHYINLTVNPVNWANPTVSSSGLAYSIVDCAEGDQFIINAVGAVTGRAWGFLNSGNTVISMAGENATVSNLELTAPANAVKLIINDKGGLTSYRVGKNLVGQVDDLKTAVASIKPGLSDEAKEALLACFAYVPWINDQGKRYYNALRSALYNDCPVIKIFRGKGISGSSIVDKDKRMLSEIIPFINTAPITMRWEENNGYRWSMKNIDSNGAIQTGVTLHYSPDEQVTGLVSWVTSENEQTLVNADQTEFIYSNTNNTCRLLFANVDDLTYDLPEDDPVGFITMTGVTYRIEVHDKNEFI